MFGFEILQGTYPKSSENRFDIVLSDEAANKYFGDRDPLGKSLPIRLAVEFISYSVVGVIENTPSNSRGNSRPLSNFLTTAKN